MITKKLPLLAKGFFSSSYINDTAKNILLLASNEEEALKLHQQILFFRTGARVLYFPSFDTVPYDRISPSNAILSQRAKVLSELANAIPAQARIHKAQYNMDPSLRLDDKVILITNATNLLVKIPPQRELAAASLQLTKGLKFTAKNLVNFLSENGFSRSPTAIDSGEFASRGEIVDIVMPETRAWRINFSWDKIESIKTYDVDTQISSGEQSELMLSAAAEIILTPQSIDNFKTNYLQAFGIGTTTHPLYEAIADGRKYPGHENLLPLFYNELALLTDYLQEPIIIYDNFSKQAILEQQLGYQDFYQARQQSNKVNPTSYYPALAPEKICASDKEIKELLEAKDNIFIEAENSEIASGLETISAASLLENKTPAGKIFEIIAENRKRIPIIFYSSASALARLKNLATQYEYASQEVSSLLAAKIGLINFARAPLIHGFYTQKYLFISEQDILGDRGAGTNEQSSKRKLKNILTELDNIQEGELVVHNNHGIGQFITVETIEVGGKPHDCLKILYAGGDKLYIPVENIEVLKKYGSGEAELDKLGNLSWQKRKSKLKNRINDIAAELLQIAAQRKLAISAGVEFDAKLYDQFCARFNFAETDDQLRAIEEVKSDLLSGQLMDRLICGDVGYGKTEVAMRAAFMIASSSNKVVYPFFSEALPFKEEAENNNLSTKPNSGRQVLGNLGAQDRNVLNIHEDPSTKLTPQLPAESGFAPQVVIIAPTTILCKQHYLRFKERFEGLGLNVLQLSRLIKPAAARDVKQQIKNGKANIIIGTHALLAKDIEFANLKMVIIDEEQHFGVAQKERLKELKSGVHVLALSATPIPRTLQMSMVGLKDLSLIATPPLDRMPVRTTVMPFDSVIIRDALMREHLRGGRSFYVCPRISELAEVARSLQEIVPELKYKVAHGQLPPSTVDEIMSEFYEGKFDILLSTTIIESGIDIASANTMIIHRSDKLGLSQLYQLRGRVGRSKVRGYAYLTISNKVATKHACRRLEIMQTVDSLGAGFTIASHDMDLRGFGNLVGDEQSGHIREVGVELYQEMLDEAIANLKDEPSPEEREFTPSINLGLPIFIAEDYIADSSLRLAIYRRVGNLLDIIEVEKFRDEMIDRFGPMPPEFANLLEIVKIKQQCQRLHIENLDSGPQGFVLKFRTGADIADMVVGFVTKHPRNAKLKPDNKLIIMKSVNQENVLKEVSEVLEELIR